MSDGRISGTPEYLPKHEVKICCGKCGGYKDAPVGNCDSAIHQPRSYISGVKPS